MNPLDAIEKLINERGSAAILREHIALLKEQMAQKDATIESQARLLKEKDVQIQNLQKEKPKDVCPFCGRATGQLVEITKERPTPRATLTFNLGHYKCSNCSKEYEKEMD